MNEPKPILPIRFLIWFCPPPLLESIEGDLTEQFEEDVKLFGLEEHRKTQ